jgi:hypothetical protein
LWLTYGLLIGSWPLIIANSIVILPQVAILVLLLRQVWIDRNGIRPDVAVQGDKGVVGA